jgi:hypothetical protein
MVAKFPNGFSLSFFSLRPNPYIGELNQVECVQEYKVEMICSDELIKKAVKVLKEVHPYEEVAYEVFRMEEV